MNSELSALMQRRSELLARIASQREQMSDVGARLQAPLAWADRGVAVARFMRSHPALVVGVIAAVVIRRRGAAGLAGVAWRLWRVYRSFAAITSRLSRT
jgi:hypothetical protein